MTENTELPEAIVEATKPENFNVLAFVKGATLPAATHTVGIDAEAGYKLSKLLERKAQIEKAAKKGDVVGIAEDSDWVDEDEIDSLRSQIAETALTFYLKGLAPKAVEAIEKHARASNEYVEGADNTEYYTEYNTTVIAKSIIKVVAADGAEDTHTWSIEEVKELSETIQTAEFAKLWSAAWELTFTEDLFAKAINADF